DVDEGGGHVDEFGGDVDILDFELVEVVEILAGDFGDLDVVDVHFLLFDEIEQEVERTFIDGDVDAVGGGHGAVISDQEAGLRFRAFRVGSYVEILHPRKARVQDDK